MNTEKVMTVKELRKMERRTRDFYEQNPTVEKAEILGLAMEATDAISILLEYQEYGLPDDITSYADDVYKQCCSLVTMINKLKIEVDPRDE